MPRRSKRERVDPRELEQLSQLVGEERAHAIRRSLIRIANDYKRTVKEALDVAYIVVSSGRVDGLERIVMEAFEMTMHAKSAGTACDAAELLTATLNAYKMDVDQVGTLGRQMVALTHIMDIPLDDVRWRNYMPAIITAGTLGVPIEKAIAAMIYHSKNPMGNGAILARAAIHRAYHDPDMREWTGRQ